MQDITVQLDLVLPQRFHVDDAAQAASDQTTDFVGAAADLAFDGFTVGTVGGGARQHRVFGGHPTQPAVFAPTWYGWCKGRRAHDTRMPAFNEHRPFRRFGEVAGDMHRTQFIDFAPIRARHMHIDFQSEF